MSSRRRNTFGRATEPKCKLMLAKSPENDHKKIWSWLLQYFSSYRVNSDSVTHTYGTGHRYILAYWRQG